MTDKSSQSNQSCTSGPASDAERDDGVRAIDVGKLAHELRTPLAAIAALSEIMRDERLGPLGTLRYRGYAADIHESALHANSVLAGYLEPGDADRRTGGPLSFIELDLGGLVTDIVSALRPLAERSGVVLDSEIAAPLPHLIADRRCLRQMLDNLIANGLKHTPPGGRIDVVIRYGVGGPVEIEIADTGDGMTADELARVGSGLAIPEPLRRRSGGSGLGLPLVRALATALGASMTMDSEFRKGTRVTVSFPHDRVVPV